MEEGKARVPASSNGRAAKKIPKQAWIASALSFLAPGVGQAFNGDLKRAACWGVTTPALAFISSPAHLTATFLGYVSCISLQLLISAFSARSAFRRANRHAGTNDSPRKSWVKSVGAAALAGIVIGAVDYAAISPATIRFYKISANSMAPTVGAGDRIAVDLRYYDHHTPQRGDVVALQWRHEVSFVKRIAALGGDVVEGREGRVFVNGEPFDDRHRVDVHSVNPRWRWMIEFGPETIPPGKCFVLGDNRGNSLDSRSPDFGFVDRTDIKGRVLYVYWSNNLSRIGRRID